MLKCASRRRTICGVISGCEGIVNARGTKRNCFWGYGSAEKYGFTARRMRISLTNVSEVAEREDRLYSFFVALVNHGSSFRILWTSVKTFRVETTGKQRRFKNSNQNLHYYRKSYRVTLSLEARTGIEARAHLTCKRKRKRNKFYLVHVIVRLALRELAHQLPSDVFRIYTVNQYKSYRKNFSTVGQIPSIRNRCLVYTRTHKFSTYYIYIFSIHTEENRSSKQTVAFLKRARDGREGWNCGPHSGVKALRSPILPLPPLYV